MKHIACSNNSKGLIIAVNRRRGRQRGAVSSQTADPINYYSSLIEIVTKKVPSMALCQEISTESGPACLRCSSFIKLTLYRKWRSGVSIFCSFIRLFCTFLSFKRDFIILFLVFIYIYMFSLWKKEQLNPVLQIKEREPFGETLKY